MLSEFPNFKPLAWADRALVKDLTSQFAPYAEFNVVNMWCWPGKYRALSRLKGNVVQMIFDERTGEAGLSFLGQGEIAETAHMLIDASASLQCGPRLRLIPEDVITADPRMRTHFRLLDEDDDSDHVLSIPEWIILPGRLYRTARSYISVFQRRYRSDFRRLALDDQETQRAMEALFCTWAHQKGVVNESATMHEPAAIRRLFTIADDAPLLGFGLYVDEEMIGVLICERGEADYAIAHYWKGDRSYRGAYCYLLHRTCQELQAEGFSVLNIGQDLGIPGLASAKRSFHPCRHLRKYAVVPA